VDVHQFDHHGYRGDGGEDPYRYRAIMLSVNHGMADVGAVSTPNHEEYCRRHHIKYQLLRPGDFESQFAPAWGKLLGIRNALLDGWEVVVWVDADAVFTNMTDDILRHLDNRHDLFMSKDFNGLNSGVMLIRNTAWASAYLDYLYGFRNAWPKGLDPCFRYEQRGFALTYHDLCFAKKNRRMAPWRNYMDVRRRIKLVDPHVFNAYECNGVQCRASKWRPGDTVYHVPGMGQKAQRIRKKLDSLQ
jgi:hypothetical protein